MVERVDKQLRRWLNVYAPEVFQDQLVVYVCLFSFRSEMFIDINYFR
jgi:hypothetical protein